MSQKIEFELAANDTSAKAAWERQQKAINGVIEKLGKLEDASAKAGRTQEGWVSKGVGKLAGMAAGYVSVTGAIGAVIAANKEMLDQADQAALKYDTIFRKVNVQSAMLGVAGEAGKKSILDTAIANAATVEESGAIAQQLAGAGFNAKDATGGALDAVLKAQAAMGEQGTGKGGVIAESAAQYLKAMGIDATGENLRKTLVAVQQSAKEGFMKFEDLSQVSGKVGAFGGKAESADVLAAFNIGRSIMGADTASTGLKIFGERTMGAAGDKQRMDLLKQVKLKPEDVDFVGESFDTVLANLDKAVASLPEEKKSGWLQRFFGGEGANFAGALIRDRGQMDKFRNVMGNEVGFAADVAEMTAGKAAARRRQDLIDERDAEERDTGFEDKLKSVRRADRKAGQMPLATDFATAAARTARYLGLSDETALSLSFGGDPMNPTRATGATAKGLADAEALKKSAEEQTALLKDIAKSVAKPPVKIVKPDVPVTPVGVRAGR
jgi:hypothetical protein